MTDSRPAGPVPDREERSHQAARLRWATLADTKALCDLFERSRPEAPETLHTMQDWLEHGGALVLENPKGGLLCGLRWREEGDGWRVDRIATLPQARGQGFGRWLMTKVEALAIRRNVAALMLAIEQDQEELLPYYRRMGYRETARQGGWITLRKRVGGVWQVQPTAAREGS